MKEGECGSKVGWKEKGPFIKRGPHEQMHSLHTLVIHQCPGNKGVTAGRQDTGGPRQGMFSSARSSHTGAHGKREIKSDRPCPYLKL